MAWEAANGRRGVQVCYHIKNASSRDEFTSNGSLQMLNVLQFEQLGRSGDMHSSAVMLKGFPHHGYDNCVLAHILLRFHRAALSPLMPSCVSGHPGPGRAARELHP